MSYQVLARKWRPGTFNDMVGQAHVLKTLANALDQDRLHHAYLFTGTRGVGKTTLARIFARCLNCEAGVSSNPCGKCSACVAIDEGRFVDLIEVDAASRAKVDETRDLMDNVQYAPTGGRYKVYLIDEIHMFSNHSFNALLKTLEEPPPHVKFLLATTEPKKLPVTILSRCLQFNLSHLTDAQIAKQIEMILTAESVPFDKPSAELIARSAAGSMRDALSLLDQAISYAGGSLEETQVRAMLGTIDSADLHGMIRALADNDPDNLLNIVESIALQNPDYDALLSEFLSLLHKIAVIQILPDDADNVLLENDDLVHFARALNKEDVQLYYQIGIMGRKDLYLAPDIKSGFEMILIRMSAFRPVQPVQPGGTSTETQGLNSTQKNAMIASDRSGNKNAESVAATKTTDRSWKDMIDDMALAGLVKQLAGHCVLKSHTKEKIELTLAPSQEHLLNQNQKERLEQALKKRFGPALELVITIAASDNETPTETDTRLERERQQAATQSVNTDPVVKSLMDTFDASVDQDSIQPQ